MRDHLEAIEIGHKQIGDNDIGWLFSEHFHKLVAVVGLARVIARLSQAIGNSVTKMFVVVDNEHGNHNPCYQAATFAADHTSSRTRETRPGQKREDHRCPG